VSRVSNEIHTSGSIVAIHGLDGHRENSWTIKNVLWLRDLLPNEIPTARILTYGYDANTRGHVQLSSQTLYDHAETFLAKLASFRQKTDVRKPMMSSMTPTYIAALDTG